jgi:hypothetical protein
MTVRENSQHSLAAGTSINLVRELLNKEKISLSLPPGN